MTTAAVTIVTPEAQVKIATWDTLANAEAGDAIFLPSFTYRSVQIVGTFGSGGTVLIEGSNDGTNYATLHDLQGVALSITAASVKSIQEVTAYLRPRCSAGDGTTALVVTMCLRAPSLS